VVFDPSGFPKSGRESVGVARQWCGRLGKVDNCQVAISLGYVLIDINLRFLSTFGDAIRMATGTRRIEEFSLSNNVVSPSRLCAGKRCQTSKPPRFTKSGQEPINVVFPP